MNKPEQEDPVRPHVFDGIQEYDKRMPNWWLWTLYGAIIYSFGYWIYFHTLGNDKDPGGAVMEQISAAQMVAANSTEAVSDETVWKMSQDATIVESGKTAYATTCASCHKPDLTGMIGPNLLDKEWIHGGQPMEVIKMITDGNLTKGMPAWGPVLGKQKVLEVAAFIMSYHKVGDEIVKVSGWVMPIPGAPAAEAAPSTTSSPAP